MSIMTFVVVVQLSLIFIAFFAYILAQMCDRLLVLWFLRCLKASLRSLAAIGYSIRWSSSQPRLLNKTLITQGVNPSS